MPKIAYRLPTLALLLWASTASAQEQPPPEQLAEAFRLQVPAWWNVGEVAVKASVNLGDAVEPKLKQRLEAKVAAASDLYVADSSAQGTFGPFLPLIGTLKAGTARTLYGVANSTYGAGRWTIDLKLENSVAELGKPVDVFGQPTVVRGSPAERALIAQLRSETAATSASSPGGSTAAAGGIASDAGATAITLTEPAAGDRQALEAALDAARAEQAEALAQLEQQQEAQLAALQETLQQRIAAYDAELKRIVATANALLDGLEQEFTTQLSALGNRMAEGPEQLAQGLQAELDTVKARFDAERQQLEQEHQAKLEQARAEIRQSQELIAAEQEKWKAMDRVAATQKATVAKEREAAAAQRTQREKQIAELEGRLKAKERGTRVAAIEEGLRSSDPVLREVVIATVGDSKDKVDQQALSDLIQKLGIRRDATAPAGQAGQSAGAPAGQGAQTAALSPGQAGKEVSLHASKVHAFTSQYSSGSWSAQQVVGPPTITQCADTAGAWAPGSGGMQTLDVGFDKPMLPKRVVVRENLSVGFVTQIELVSDSGEVQSFPVKDTLTQCPGDAVFEIKNPKFATSRIRVTINADHSPGYEEIDSIRMDGISVE